MFSENASRILVGDAESSDVRMLTAIKADRSQALHRDRLRDAQNGNLRLPLIVDLYIKESRRGLGFGSQFMGIIERMAAEAGFEQLFLRVEPLDNPRAYLLYQRLGYQPEQSEPYRTVWEFRDSDGHLHRGENWVVDMMKFLNR